MTTPKSIGTYRDFLHADYGHSFAEWLGFDAPRYVGHYNYDGSWECYMVSSRAQGSWQKTKKAAKASYKEALRRNRRAEVTV